jgi:hypothetical protein
MLGEGADVAGAAHDTSDELAAIDTTDPVREVSAGDAAPRSELGQDVVPFGNLLRRGVVGTVALRRSSTLHSPLPLRPTTRVSPGRGDTSKVPSLTQIAAAWLPLRARVRRTTMSL